MILLDLIQKLVNVITPGTQTNDQPSSSIFDNSPVTNINPAQNQPQVVQPEQNDASVFVQQQGQNPQQPISFLTIPPVGPAQQPPVVFNAGDNVAASMMISQAQLEQSKTLLPDTKIPDYADLKFPEYVDASAPEEEKSEPNADELLQTISFIEQEENAQAQFIALSSFEAADGLGGPNPDAINPDGATDDLIGSGFNTMNPENQVNTLPNEIFNPDDQDIIPNLGGGIDPLEGGDIPEQLKPQDDGIDPLGSGDIPEQLKPQDGEMPLSPGGGEGGSVLPGDDAGGIGGPGGCGYVTGPSGTGDDSSEINPGDSTGVYDSDDKTVVPYDKIVDIVNEKVENKEIEISDPNKLIDFLKDQKDPIETIEKIQQLQEANVDIEQLIENKEEAKKVLEMPKEELQKVIEVIKEAIKEDPELADTKVDIIAIIEEIKKQADAEEDGDKKTAPVQEQTQQPQQPAVPAYENEIKHDANRPAVYTTPQGDIPYVEGLNEAAAQDALKKNEPIVKTYASNWTNINAVGDQEDTSGFSHIIQAAEEDNRVNPTKRQSNNVLPEYVMTGAVDMAMAEEVTPEGKRIAKKSGVKLSKVSKKENKVKDNTVQNTTANNYIAPIEDEEHDVQKHFSAGKRSHQEAAAAAAAADGKQMSTYLVDKNEAANTKYEGSLANLQSRNKISTDEYRLGKIEHCNTKNAGYYLDKDIQINPNGTEMTLNQASSTLVSEYTEAHMVNGERIRNYYDKNAVLIIQENETNGTSIVKAGDNGAGYVKYDSQGNITEISPNGQKSYQVKQQNNGVYTLVEIQNSFAFPKESIKAFL